MTKHFDLTDSADKYLVVGDGYFAHEEFLTKAQVVKDIASGQFDRNGHLTVYRANLADNSFRDVSEDIAREVLAIVCDEYNERDDVPDHLVNFCEDHIGVCVIEASMAEA